MGYVLLIVALTLNAAANVLIKVGADRLGPVRVPEALGAVLGNWYLLAGLVLFALNVVFYVGALARLDLSLAYPVMMAGGVLLVACASILYLKEPISLQYAAGIVCLIAGLVLVTQRTAA